MPLSGFLAGLGSHWSVFAVLAVSDLRLEALSGFGTADLQRFSTAQQYNAAFMVWPSLYAVRAGFNWGLDYLVMPLYAMSFFYSGIIAREGFAPTQGCVAIAPDAMRRLLPRLGRGAKLIVE